MNESVSYTYLLNIILIFIAVVFMALMGTLSYTKAFRVNSKIANAIEICEGYNSCSFNEIDRIITSYGYQRRPISCPTKYGTIDNDTDTKTKEMSGYCIYKFDNNGDDKHYSYGILTYMYIDVPVIGDILKIPVYSKTDRVYKFN